MSLIPSNLFGRTNIYDLFSLDMRDPFFNFPAVADHSGVSSEAATFANTRIDRTETPKAYVFKVDAPGLRKEEMKVEVEGGNVLKISGERQMEEEEDGDTWYRTARSSSQFLRRFLLPKDAKMESTEAVMENGVLTVTVPKKRKPKAIAIN